MVIRNINSNDHPLYSGSPKFRTDEKGHEL